MERVVIYIDGSNLYHSLKFIYGRIDVDFEKLATKLIGNRQLIRIYYYNAPVNADEEPEKYRNQQKFFERLQTIDYLRLVLGRIEKQGNHCVEKGVDVQLAVDMIRLANKNTYDTAILVSGDGDFAPAIEIVQDWGKHVEVAFPSRSSHLLNICDRYSRLDEEFMNGCWLMNDIQIDEYDYRKGY